MFFWNSCFFDDPAEVSNLISGSSSKTSWNICKFMVHVLLKPGLENFEHYFASVLNECDCALVWAFFGIAFLRDWNETDLLQSCDHCWVFQICWKIECSTFTALSFRIWNSSTGIPSPSLALFVVMLPQAHSTWCFRTSNHWCIEVKSPILLFSFYLFPLFFVHLFLPSWLWLFKANHVYYYFCYGYYFNAFTFFFYFFLL